jgi:hypothetical protein
MAGARLIFGRLGTDAAATDFSGERAQSEQRGASHEMFIARRSGTGRTDDRHVRPIRGSGSKPRRLRRRVQPWRVRAFRTRWRLWPFRDDAHVLPSFRELSPERRLQASDLASQQPPWSSGWIQPRKCQLEATWRHPARMEQRQEKGMGLHAWFVRLHAAGASVAFVLPGNSPARVS